MNILVRFCAAICSLIALSILSPARLCAQIASPSITVTASQSTALQPSQAVFQVAVNAPFSASLNNVVAAVSSVGISASNLVNIGGGSPPVATPFQNATSPSLSWTFQLTAPFSNQKSIASALAALQNTIGQNNSGLSLAFSVSGTSAAYSQTCSLSSLVSNALTEPQSLATAAGQGLGGIIGLNSAVASPSGAPCSLGVKFALAGPAWEAGPHTISVNASQSVSVPPDQTSIAIGVNSGLAVALDDITAALTIAGINGTTFIGMNTIPNYQHWVTTATDK